MRRRKIFHCAAVGIAGLGLTMPPAAPAVERAPIAAVQQFSHAPAVTDVALRTGGLLQGQIVDAQGQGTTNASVFLKFKGRLAAVARTNSQGYFSVQGLRGGTFQISAAGGSGVYRLWAANSAPPAASSGVLIVAGSEAVRSEQSSAWEMQVSGPRLLMLGVMGGIVTGSAIAQSDQRSES